MDLVGTGKYKNEIKIEKIEKISYENIGGDQRLDQSGSK